MGENRSAKIWSEIDPNKFTVLRPKPDAKRKVISVFMEGEDGRLEPVVFQTPKMRLPHGVSDDTKFEKKSGENTRTKYWLAPAFYGEEKRDELVQYRAWLTLCIDTILEKYLPYADQITPRKKKKHDKDSLYEITGDIIKKSKKEGFPDYIQEKVTTDYNTGVPSSYFFRKRTNEDGKKVTEQTSYTEVKKHCDAIRVVRLEGLVLNPTATQLFPTVNLVQCLYYPPPEKVSILDKFKTLKIVDNEESDVEDDVEYIQETDEPVIQNDETVEEITAE